MQTRQHPPGGVRLNRLTIGILIGILVLVTAALVYVAISIKFSVGASSTSQPAPAAAASTERLPEVITQRKRDYGQPQPATATPTPAAAVTKDATATTSGAITGGRTPEDFRPTPPVGLGDFQGTTTTGQTGHAQATSGTNNMTNHGGRRSAQAKPQSVTRSTKPARKPGWLFPERKNDQQAEGPPFPLPKDEENTEGSEGNKRGRSSQLFPKAVWETPEDPTKVLYSSQLIPCVLSQDVNTDIPGSVRCRVTQQVEDRWNQGRVLVPLYTTFIGKTEGTVKYGQARIPLQITKAEFPDGTDVRFEGQAGDAGGAQGLPGRVNNHYGKLILGVMATAVLNIGTRAPFGSTQGFQQSLPQEFAQQAGQGFNQAGQEFIRRELAVQPTITQEHGFPVTISFEKNISFQTPPRKVKQ